MSNNLLFVYGSMSEGMVHFKHIEKFVEDIKPGTTSGSVYRLDVGFPVFLTRGSDKVRGQILTIKSHDVILRLLDGLHGYSVKNRDKSLFHRDDIRVIDSSGETLISITYSMNPLKLPKTAKLIESGDWDKDMNENPPFVERLTEKQAEYISRLGKSTGRDIVPINLDLYRELMSLGVIVDKGRRLALTKFGKEVYRYL